MKKPCIAVLYSLVKNNKENYNGDVEAVSRALCGSGYNIKKIPVSTDIEELVSNIKKFSPKCIFNLCEEVNGNSRGEVYIAGILELLRIPYTGTGPLGLMLSLDKARNKEILQSNGVKSPKYQVFYSDKDVLSKTLLFPLIVKPLHEDGSYGINLDSVVHNKRNLYKKIHTIHRKFKQPAIAEEYIEGRELNVSLLGNGKKLKVLPISEIDYSSVSHGNPKICTYNAKWNTKSGEYKETMSVCPANLSEKTRKTIENVSIRAYRSLECRDYARIDIRLDKNRNPYIIDVNPNPCLSPDSGFVRSAEKAGISYIRLIDTILNNCMERRCKKG